MWYNDLLCDEMNTGFSLQQPQEGQTLSRRDVSADFAWQDLYSTCLSLLRAAAHTSPEIRHCGRQAEALINMSLLKLHVHD